MLRQLAQAQQLLDAARAGMRADFGVQLRRGIAQLADLPHHEYARRRIGGQHVDAGLHRIRIGVVAVVDHGGTASGRLQLQTALDAGKGPQTGGDGGQRHVQCQRHRGGGQRVAHIVLAGGRQLDRLLALRAAQHEAAAGGAGDDVAGADVGRSGQTKAQLAMVAGGGGEDCLLRVVGIDDGDAVGAEAFKDLALGAGDVGGAVKAAAQVCAHGVVDQRHLRPRQTGEVADLAEMVHAHLDHRIAVRRAQRQQRQRQADVVVEVAGGGVHGISTGVGAQDGGHHLLDRGLAVGAGDADALYLQPCAPGGGQGAQRQPGVGDADHAAARRLEVMAHQRKRALGQYLGHEVVRVEVVALQRHEQVAGLRRAAVGDHALEHGIAAGQFAGQQAGGVRQRQHRWPPRR